jgi:hypothetical protein
VKLFILIPHNCPRAQLRQANTLGGAVKQRFAQAQIRAFIAVAGDAKRPNVQHSKGAAPPLLTRAQRQYGVKNIMVYAASPTCLRHYGK